MVVRGLFLPLILISVLGFVLYAHVINGKFIWDDQVLIKDNTYIRSWAGIAKIFTSDIGGGAGRQYGYYRPLQLFSYMLEYACGGLDVRVYHITNILLHIFVALCIWWVVIMLYGDRLLALLVGIIFISHPIQTETVSYLSNRGDLLSALFLLAAFIFYIRGLESKDTLAHLLMMISYLLALLSKENAMIFMGILWLYHYVFKKKFSLRYFLPILMVTVIYMFFRVMIIKSTLPLALSFRAASERIPGFFVALTNYLRLLFFPFGLHFVYGNKVFKFTDAWVGVGILLTILIMLYALGVRKKDRIIFFSVFWFFLTLLPNSGIYPVTTFYMAEHYLYLPAIGFSLILARCIRWFYATRKLKALAIFISLAIVIFYGYSTIKQNSHWQKPINFYLRELQFSPDSPEVYYNLGGEYDKINDQARAIFLYRKAIALNPYSESAYNNLGVIYSHLDNRQEALMLFRKAIELNPRFVKAYNNLGVIYSHLDNRQEALMLFRKAIELNPRFTEAYNNLGIIYYDFNRREESIASFKKALQINPNYAVAYYNLAVAYYHQKEYELALKYCKQATQLGYRVNPDFLKLLQAETDEQM